MSISRRGRIGVAALLAACLVAAIAVVVWQRAGIGKTELTAYFSNSNGIYEGDDVLILGVPVGKIDKIEPQPRRSKVTFHIDDKYKEPTHTSAVIINPTLAYARTGQLTSAN